MLTSTVGFYLLTQWGLGLTAYPRSIFIIDPLLLVIFLGGIRLARRIYREMGHLDREKRVLVTVAGGSIGSELCRQIAALQPGLLILYERYENGLYAINYWF